ncbi:SlyX family protein [uncultured Abyssibacter sp.]|uniref:SlyX family protein n=1 Tax=uncultured Abyssibacter sp. TaxID=2320202 RepID=UPI0032B26219
MTSDDHRIANLEALHAHQDEALRQLSDALYAQQRLIQSLELELSRMKQRMEAAEQSGGEAQTGHEVPPHY